MKRPHIPTWQRLAEIHIEPYLDIKTGEIDDVFKEHVEHLRDNLDELDIYTYPANVYPSYLTQFMKHFQLPIEMKGLIRHYLKTDEINLSLMRPPIAVVDDRNNTYRLNIDEVDEEEYWEDYQDLKSVKLIIPDKTTVTEIIEFVRREKRFIDDHLSNSSQKRKKTKETPAWVAIRIVNLRRNGLSNDRIAEKARIESWPIQPINADNVVAILRRSKNLYK